MLSYLSAVSMHRKIKSVLHHDVLPYTISHDAYIEGKANRNASMNRYTSNGQFFPSISMHKVF